MENKSVLYTIEEPAAPAGSNTLHISGIRSHGPAEARPVQRPWPRQGPWRNLRRQITKNHGRRTSGRSESR
jgi:hypothetical protein